MALQSLHGGGFFYPRMIGATGAVAPVVSLTLDASGEKIGWVLQAAATGAIDAIWFRTGTVTTGDTVDVRIETVDPSTGLPTGTLWSANTNVSVVIANGDD